MDKKSKLGYKKNSPYKNKESLLINSNVITTEDMAFPILAMGNGGESSMLYPNTGEFIFPNSTKVMEINPNFSNMKTNKKYGGGGQVNEYEILSNYLPTLSPEEQDQFIDMYENSTPDNKMNILMKCGGMMKYQQGGLAKGQKVPEEYANAEVEGGETALTPDGMLMKFNGPSHAQGGINTNLEEGTKIFSEHLKVPEEVQRGLGLKKVNKKLSYAKLSEKLKTKPFIEMMNETDDPYKLNAAKVQLEKNMAMLESLFFAQEKDKEIKGMDKPEFTDGKKVYAQKGIDLSKISNRFVPDSRGILTDPVTNKSYYRNDDGSYTEFDAQSTFVQNPNSVPVGETNRTFNVSDNVLMGAPDPFDPIGAALMTAAVGLGAAGAGYAAPASTVADMYGVVSLPGASSLMAGMSHAGLRNFGLPKDNFRDAYEENYMKDLRSQLDPFAKENIINYIPRKKSDSKPIITVVPTPQPAPQPKPGVTPKPSSTNNKRVMVSPPRFNEGTPEDAITAGEAELGPVTPFIPKSYIPPAYRAEESYNRNNMDTGMSMDFPKPQSTSTSDKEKFGINQKLLGTLADIGLVMSDRLNIDNPTIYNRQKNPMFNRFYEFDNREAQRMADRQIQGIMNSNLPEQVKQAQIAAVTSQMQDQQGRVDFANAQRYEQKREMDLNKLQQYTDANLESRINEFDIYRQKMARVKDLQNQFKANRKQQIVNSAKDYWEYTNKLNTLNELNPYFELSPITGRTRYKPQPKSELDSMQQKLNQYAKNPQAVDVGGGTKVADMGDFLVVTSPTGEVKIVEKNKSSQSTPTTKDQMMQMYFNK
jgi:hypothetical protein